MFAADEALFDKFLWLNNKIGIQIRCKFLLLVHTKDDQPKDQTVKSAHNTLQAS